MQSHNVRHSRMVNQMTRGS